MSGRYECDYCGTPVEVRQGRKTRLAFWNCANCGLHVNCRPGSKVFNDLAKAGLIQAVG